MNWDDYVAERKANDPEFRAARVDSGLTQRDLAQRPGVKQSALARWEAGRTMATLDTLLRVAKALDVDFAITPDAPLVVTLTVGRRPSAETTAGRAAPYYKSRPRPQQSARQDTTKVTWLSGSAGVTMDSMRSARVTAFSTHVIMFLITYLKETVMPALRPSTDVLPVTEFRANTSAFLSQLRANKRPIVLTQNGRSAAVVLDVGEYEALLDQIALLRDIGIAEEQVSRGEGLSHEEAVQDLRSRLAT